MVLEYLDELLGLKIGFGTNVGVLEKLANGKGVVGINAGVVLEVVTDAIELGLGGVVEASHVGIEHGFDEGLERLAFASGDGFVGVRSEAVALLHEDEFFTGGGHVWREGGHFPLAGIVDGGAGADRAGGRITQEGDDALVGFLKLLLGAGLLGAGAVQLLLELIDLGGGSRQSGESLLECEIRLLFHLLGGGVLIAELGLDLLFEKDPSADGDEPQLHEHEDDDAGDDFRTGLRSLGVGAGVLGCAGHDRLAGRIWWDFHGLGIVEQSFAVGGRNLGIFWVHANGGYASGVPSFIRCGMKGCERKEMTAAFQPMSSETPSVADAEPVQAGEGRGMMGFRGRWLAVGAGLLAWLVLFLFWPYQHWHFPERLSVLGGWFRMVLGQSEWVFCLIVPLLTAWLVHRDRKKTALLPMQGEWWGAAVVAVALVVFWMGYKVDTGYPGFIAAHLSLAGVIVLLGGLPWMRALFFPWLFLAFMWPMFPLEERLAFPLRMMTAGLSGKFLNLIGVDVIREGTALYSAADPVTGLVQGDLFRLDVEEPCSGIRSLFSLMMVSALYGYIALKMPIQRLLLFASAIPMAMLGNFVRMVLLALGSLWFGTEVAVGRNIEGHQEMSFFHSMAGYAVFAVALAGMFGLCTFLESKWMRGFIGAPPKKRSAKAVAASYGEGLAERPLLMRSVVALVLSGVGIAVCAVTDISPTVAPPGVELKLPLQFGSFQGQVLDMTAQERNILDAGVELARNIYASETGQQFLATLIVGGDGKRTLHRPEVCLPGQGWTIAEQSTLPIKRKDGSIIHTTLLRMFRDSESEGGVRMRMRALNLYWYIGSDGTTSPDYYDHIRVSYQDAIFKNLNHRWSMASFFFPMKPQPLGTEDPFAEVGLIEEAKKVIRDLAPTFEAARDREDKS